MCNLIGTQSICVICLTEVNKNEITALKKYIFLFCYFANTAKMKRCADRFVFMLHKKNMNFPKITLNVGNVLHPTYKRHMTLPHVYNMCLKYAKPHVTLWGIYMEFTQKCSKTTHFACDHSCFITYDFDVFFL